MKKRFSLLASTGLALSILVSAPITSSALTNTSAPIETQALSMTISELVVTPGKITPSSTYRYNSRGWTGTLYLQSYAYDGTYTLATYKGTVTCSSGSCPAPTNITETE